MLQLREAALAVGFGLKFADLAVLSDNPLTVPAMAIKDIQVLETVFEGKTVYRR